MRLLLRISSLALALCLVLWAVPALGDSVFLIDLDALDMTRVGEDAYVRQYLSAGAQTIRVSKYVGAGEDDTTSIRLTVLRADTKQTVFDKDYGLVGGTFESGDIYLPYPENGTMYYLVTLYLGQWVYAVPYLQGLPRLYDNGACSGGFRFSEASGGLSGDWLMGTMIDMNGLKQNGGVTQAPLCASNQYLLGYANLTLVGDTSLQVDILLNDSANVELTRYHLYLIPDVAGVTSLRPHDMAQPEAALGQPVDVGNAPYVLLYLPMTVNFDPAALPAYDASVSAAYTQYQLALWETARAWVAPATAPETSPELPPQEFPQPTPEGTPAVEGEAADPAAPTDGATAEGGVPEA